MIVHADCREILPVELPQPAVMITDPPYSPRVHAGMTSCAAQGARKGVRQRDAGFAPLDVNLRLAIAALGARCRWSVVFCDWESLHLWIEAFAEYAEAVRYVRAIPWVRWSSPQFSGDRPPQGSECIALFGTNAARMHWHGPGNLTHFDAACERGLEKHPTAKPLDLVCELVEYFSDPTELVLDPCAGRGTTALAAKLLGRRTIGIEIDAAEAALAQLRFEQPLSERDAERWRRYCALATARGADGERRRVYNAKLIAGRKAKSK